MSTDKNTMIAYWFKENKGKTTKYWCLYSCTVHRKLNLKLVYVSMYLLIKYLQDNICNKSLKFAPFLVRKFTLKSPSNCYLTNFFHIWYISKLIPISYWWRWWSISDIYEYLLLFDMWINFTPDNSLQDNTRNDIFLYIVILCFEERYTFLKQEILQ